jgi:hypothetical protein
MQMMNGQIISHQFGDGLAVANPEQFCGVSETSLRSAGQRIGWIRLAGRLAPEDGVGSFVEVVEQVLDLWAGV